MKTWMILWLVFCTAVATTNHFLVPPPSYLGSNAVTLWGWAELVLIAALMIGTTVAIIRR